MGFILKTISNAVMIFATVGVILLLLLIGAADWALWDEIGSGHDEAAE